MSNWIGPTVKQLWNFAINVLHNFLGLNISNTPFCLGRYSLHLLLLKSSMTELWRHPLAWFLLKFHFFTLSSITALNILNSTNARASRTTSTASAAVKHSSASICTRSTLEIKSKKWPKRFSWKRCKTKIICWITIEQNVPTTEMFKMWSSPKEALKNLIKFQKSRWPMRRLEHKTILPRWNRWKLFWKSCRKIFKV